MTENSEISPRSTETAEPISPFDYNNIFDLNTELECVPEVEEEKNSDSCRSFLETDDLIIESDNRFYFISQAGATLGRTSDNNIVAHSKSASSKHCKIEYIDNSFYLSDCSSFNGTWIAIREAMQITESMYIRIENLLIGIKKLNFKKPEIILSFPQLTTEVIIPKTVALIGKSEKCDAIIRKSIAAEDIQAKIECLESNQGLIAPTIEGLFTMRRIFPFQKHKLEVGDVFFCGEDRFIVRSSEYFRKNSDLKRIHSDQMTALVIQVEQI